MDNKWVGVLIVVAIGLLAYVLFDLLPRWADLFVSWMYREPDEGQGHWEVIHIPDEKILGTGFYKVRWSVADEQGRWLWVRHYGYDGIEARQEWCKHAAETSCDQLNREGRRPEEYSVMGRR